MRMKKWLSRIFALVIISSFYGLGYSGGPMEKSPKGSSGKSVKIVKTFSGVCNVYLSASKDHKVIRTKKEYLSFIKSIPKKEIGMGPMPDSKDPLLKKPKIDFKKYMILVVIGPNPLEHRHPQITDVKETSNKITVYYNLPKRPNYPMQWPQGVGYYYAAVIAKSTAPVQFIKN